MNIFWENKKDVSEDVLTGNVTLANFWNWNFRIHLAAMVPMCSLDILSMESLSISVSCINVYYAR